MTSFTPHYVGGICQQCNTGEMYQYQEDPTGVLRCGLCGELELNDEDEPVQQNPKTVEVEPEEVPEVKPKRTYTRRKAA